jgi:hypothetical protein
LFELLSRCRASDRHILTRAVQTYAAHAPTAPRSSLHGVWAHTLTTLSPHIPCAARDLVAAPRSSSCAVASMRTHRRLPGVTCCAHPPRLTRDGRHDARWRQGSRHAGWMEAARPAVLLTPMVHWWRRVVLLRLTTSARSSRPACASSSPCRESPPPATWQTKHRRPGTVRRCKSSALTVRVRVRLVGRLRVRVRVRVRVGVRVRVRVRG